MVGVIEMAILGILDEHEVHGYELKKRMSELAGGQGGVSFGSLYPALNRLERAGFVRTVDQAKPRLSSSFTGPMTGAITGELAALRQKRKAAAEEATPTRRTDKRNRKVYGITDKGRGQLRQLLLTADPRDERSFSLQVAFCHHVLPVERIELFDRRRTHLLAELTARSAARPPGEPSEANHYLRSLREHDLHTLNGNLSWVDELIAIARDELAGVPPAVAVPATGGTHPS